MIAALAASVSGCAAPALYTSASALPAGDTHTALEGSFVGFLDAAGFREQPLPRAALAFRHGVTERLELGFRIGTSVELLAKYQFTSPGRDGLVLSLAPTAGGMVLPWDGFIWKTPLVWYGELRLQEPLLIGYRRDGEEVFVGPRFVQAFPVLGSRVGFQLFVGASVGAFLKLTEGVAAVPELNVLAAVHSVEPTFQAPIQVQAGIGLVFTPR